MVAIRSSATQVAKSLRGIDLTGIRVRLVDAENQIVGRLASQLSLILQGKDKPTYLPSRDNGDVCVVVNAAKVFLSKKWNTKVYRWHTGYPGGLRERAAKTVLARRPEDILWRAVSGMLPKNRLQRARLRKLLLFKDENHRLHDVNLVKWEMPESITKKQMGRSKKRARTVKK